MFYYENRTTKEIAEYLNCTVGNVKVILHRVRKKIRKILALACLNKDYDVYPIVPPNDALENLICH